MLRTLSITILLFLGFFTATAFASSAVPVDGSMGDYAQIALNAIAHGQWWAVGSLAVVMICAALKKYLPAKYQQGELGDIVGTGIAFLMGAAVAMASSALTPGFVFSMATLGLSAKVGLGAVGLYNVLHKLLGYLATASFVPSWLKPVLALVGNLVGSDAIAKAKAAGDAAVAAKPSTGLADGATVKEVE